MTVMRHWVARAPSGDRVARVLDTAEKAEHYREALGFDVSGPFVLESATQGAVSLHLTTAEVHAAIQAAYSHGRHDRPALVEDAVRAVLVMRGGGKAMSEMERWSVNACPCGATADGTMPERLIHRGNCVFEHFQAKTVDVVPADQIAGAVERIAELERENLELRSQVAAYVEHLREYGDPADDPTGGV